MMTIPATTTTALALTMTPDSHNGNCDSDNYHDIGSDDDNN